jgi:hypothetical protein
VSSPVAVSSALAVSPEAEAEPEAEADPEPVASACASPSSPQASMKEAVKSNLRRRGIARIKPRAAVRVV